MYWVLVALGESGHISEGLAIIENYYGYLLDSGATTWWERFDALSYHSASLSHVWGGSPTWFLSTYLLGAKWEGPSTWSVRPAFTGVTRAAGSIPLDVGTLRVEWARPTCDQGSLIIESDKNTWGEIVIPFTESVLTVNYNGSIVYENGSIVADNAIISSSGLVLRLPGGVHSLTIQFDC
jgi:hypothetical protein